MLILDTDHLSELDRAATAGHVLRARLTAAGTRFGTTIVSIEEQIRGQFALLARHRDPQRLVPVYAKVHRILADFSTWTVLPWNDAAVQVFAQLRVQRIAVGTMDLRIASIALAHDATLLTRNLRDFQRVPDLKVEDWLA